MDLRKVRKLIEIFNDSRLSEMEIREGEESIRLTRTTTAAPLVERSSVPHPHVMELDENGESEEVESDVFEGAQEIISPMVGTFYRASTPGAENFVEIGDKVVPGQTLCLIEAMKIFNQIESSYHGTVVKIFKESGDPVEYGEPMFLIQE